MSPLRHIVANLHRYNGTLARICVARALTAYAATDSTDWWLAMLVLNLQR